MTRNGKKSNKTLSSVEYPPKRVIRVKICFIEFKCTNGLNYVGTTHRKCLGNTSYFVI